MNKKDAIQIDRLNASINEAEVKNAYIELFGLTGDQGFVLESGRVDLQGENLWIEFKQDVNLSNIKMRARVLGQMLHYIYQAQYSGTKVQIPSSICLADANECLFYQTADFQQFIEDDNYFMMVAPCQEKPELEEALINKGNLDTKIFHPQTELEDLRFEFSQRVKDTTATVRKIITDENFCDIYKQWMYNIGKYIEHGAKIQGKTISLPNLYIEDISKVTQLVDSKLAIAGGIYEVDKSSYNRFWRIFYRPVKDKTLLEISKKLDRLKDSSLRERNGVFYTPELYAAEGVNRIVNALGLSSKEDLADYYIWDMCAGTGNLELSLPTACYDKLFMSTLDECEVTAVNNSGWFRGANVFQYDYLNDDVDLVFGNADLLDDSLDWKLPRNLREALANKENKWIVLINPPYAEATTVGAKHKSGTAKTKLKDIMQTKKLGKASNELYVQFMYRIFQELPTATLGMYSSLKYINAPSCEKFRNECMDINFLDGFYMNSRHFDGIKKSTSDYWAVSFAIFDLENEAYNALKFDILETVNDCVEIIGTKTISYVESAKTIGSKEWINSTEFSRSEKVSALPLKRYNALSGSKTALDKLPVNAIGYMQNNSSNVQQSDKYVSLYSSAFGSAHGHPVTKCNFVRSIVTHAIRKVCGVLATWTANRDEFMMPTTELSKEFESDCVVFSMFERSNNTSALKNFEYNNEFYTISNEFFPFPFDAVSDSYRSLGFDMPREDRHAAKVIQGYQLSPEAQEQYDSALAIYRRVYESFTNRFDNYSLDFINQEYLTSSDLGMKQVLAAFKYLSDNGKMPAEEYKTMLKRFMDARVGLRDKIHPSIYKYGFLSQETWFDNKVTPIFDAKETPPALAKSA